LDESSGAESETAAQLGSRESGRVIYFKREPGASGDLRGHHFSVVVLKHIPCHETSAGRSIACSTLRWSLHTTTVTDKTYAVAAATSYCLPFVKLRKFGSKVPHPSFLDNFRPAGRKLSRKRKKKYHSAEG
jgi:hypothetical protein